MMLLGGPMLDQVLDYTGYIMCEAFCVVWIYAHVPTTQMAADTKANWRFLSHLLGYRQQELREYQEELRLGAEIGRFQVFHYGAAVDP